MKLLDLFCCQGGAASGYEMAGFTEIVGVDIEPQPRYPYTFVQGDALEYVAAHGHEFDLIHASPPCQAYSTTKSLHSNVHPDLVEPTRVALITTGRPYVIENVVGAPLLNYIKLTGLMFGLKVFRERWFETSVMLLAPPKPKRKKWMTTNSQHGRGISSFANGATHIAVTGHNFCVEDAKTAMKIDWMNQHGLSQAIPPAYTKYIGENMIMACELRYIGE